MDSQDDDLPNEQYYDLSKWYESLAYFLAIVSHALRGWRRSRGARFRRWRRYRLALLRRWYRAHWGRRDRRLRHTARILRGVRDDLTTSLQMVHALPDLDEQSRRALMTVSTRAAVFKAARDSVPVDIGIGLAAALAVAAVGVTSPIVAATLLQVRTPSAGWLLCLPLSWLLSYLMNLLIRKVIRGFWSRPVAVLLGAVAGWYAWAHQQWLGQQPWWYAASAVGGLGLFTTLAALHLPARVLDWAIDALWRRQIGTLSPAHAAAHTLLQAVGHLQAAQHAALRATGGRAAASILTAAADQALRAMRQSARSRGLQRIDRRWVSERAADLTAAIHLHRRNLLTANTFADLTHIRSELARQAAGLARGDWSVVTQTPSTSAHLQITTSLRRLLPSLVLGAAAITLPYLPGVEASDATLTTTRIALLIAALTGLVSPDSGTRDLILSAWKDVTHRR
ncbi:MAG TPA: hypothetical protein VGN37_23735 [Actinocatenispora sp.]